MTIDLATCVFVGKSATRECYVHPADAGKCIKVFIDPHAPEKLLTREIGVYRKVSRRLSAYIPAYDEALAETSKGKGVVSTLLRDRSGDISRDIRRYLEDGGDRDGVLRQLAAFFDVLRKNNLFFYDFNYKNFVVQMLDDGPRLKYIDLKSYKRNKSILKLDWIPCFARRMMNRRIGRFYKILSGFAPKASV